MQEVLSQTDSTIGIDDAVAGGDTVSVDDDKSMETHDLSAVTVRLVESISE